MGCWNQSSEPKPESSRKLAAAKAAQKAKILKERGL